ncbi:NUDIX hydrolase [Novipirellula artificiosorum]|uniref:Nudix hydrolase domain-containing protein n=1 Tax=Novipirellula artificiosorum TaxID=2528016 RepID=A0A5C6DBS9_9BACT|nr:NUDIX hydrolase [Novipirellula artificiosorum]TWU32656.1 hypothetical protein Poly41_56340 [Novipirellula artificiosorum]
MNGFVKILRFVTLSLLIFSCEVVAQDSISPNRNYFKLYVLNEKNEVLLVEYRSVWEPIGGGYNSSLNMEDYVRKLAMTANVKATEIRLRGLFSVFYNKSDQPIVYHYYTVRYTSGEIKTPEDCTGVKWVNLDEAGKIMGYEEMVEIYAKVLENRNLWGGTYRITKDNAKETREVEKLVDFFKLN